ncbi:MULTISPECIES: immunity 49 family protein [Actinosynnema]|uniref:immunity 49 family protein n=1 Tax=Actinosynnema TaxID=40566 RepID=UPI0020A30275|nr:immunity 49 family protein [Actinosynnema pretiosum]
MDLEEQITGLIGAVAHSPWWLNMLMNTAWARLGHSFAVDPRGASGDTWDSALFACQVGEAIFKVASADEGVPVEVELGDQVVRTTGAGPSHYSNAGQWVTSVWLAYVTMNEPLIQRLIAVPEELLRASKEDVPEYLYALAEVIRRFSRSGSSAAEAINAALRATDPAVVPELMRTYALKIVVPVLGIFQEIGDRDSERFNLALEEALVQHREYWTATDEEESDPVGFFALGPLALTVFANAVRIPVTVESEYLPHHVAAGTWPRERGAL